MVWMEMSVEYPIIDNRVDFKNATFNNYKRTEVIKKFQDALIENKIENAIYWLCELHISGRVGDIWSCFILILSKHINIENPHLPAWLYLKYKKFQKIISTIPPNENQNQNKNQYQNQYLQSRNNQEIRFLLIETTFIISEITKNRNLMGKIPPKIVENNFTQEDVIGRAIQDQTKTYNIYDVMERNEDLDLQFALKETVAQLEQNYSKIEDTIYWYFWIEKFLKLKELNKYEIKIKMRTNSKKIKDFQIIFWNVLLNIGKNLNDDEVYNQLKALHKLFLIDNCIYLLFTGFLFVKNQKSIWWKTPIVKNDILLSRIYYHTNHFYKKLNNPPKSPHNSPTEENPDNSPEMDAPIDASMDAPHTMQKKEEIVNPEQKRTQLKIDLFNNIVVAKQ